MRQPIMAALTGLILLLHLTGFALGQDDIPLQIDVNEGEDVDLECRFLPQLSKKDTTLFWIKTNRNGSDNAAIGGTAFGENYEVNYNDKTGVYDLRIHQATYDRDNGHFECKMKEGRTGNKLHSKSVELTVLLKPFEPTISPSSPIATEDKPLNLTCASLGGSPPPEIQWYAGSQSQPLQAKYIPGQSKDEPTQSVLTIIPSKDDDGNSYRCTVWNRALGENQKLEASTKIFVNYFPRVTVNPDNPLKVEKDETAILECFVDAKPTVNSVKWTRNGRYIDNHFKHTIPRVTLQDSGSYICSADNNLGRIGEMELKLDVLHAPIITLPERRDASEGEDIAVDCQVSSNPRPTTVEWFKEGDEKFTQNGPTLRLNSITAEHGGKYICSATNHLHPSGKEKVMRTGNGTVDINIRHKPGTTFISPEKPVAVDGKPLTLTCGANPPGFPLPQYKWWKEGSDTSLAVGADLNLESVRLSNAGKYLCQPVNEQGEGTIASIQVDVFQAPKIVTQLQPTIVKRAGDTGFHITCSAVGKPKPLVKWFKDGQEILVSESNMYQITTTEQETIAMAYNVLSTLKFVGPERISANQLMPTDRGHYSCQFNNDVGDEETVMFLRIEHSPVVVHQHNKVAFDIGETAVIDCQMQAFPVPRFDWSFGNSILQSDRQFYETSNSSIGDDVYEGELRINSVVESSYGDYICKGVNGMGAKRTIIKLQPKGKPERPVNIVAVDTGFNFITLGWDEGFNGGYNDTMFTVQYRRQDDEMPRYEDCRHKNPCNITGLEQHSQYFIKVKASNILGESKYSEEISAITKIDVMQIPKPSNVHFETSTNTASFSFKNEFLPIVAIIELENPDGTWSHYSQIPMGDSDLGQMKISAPVNNLRVKLCLESNEHLCGPFENAQIVEVRPNIDGGSIAQPWVIAVVVVIVIAGLFAVIVIIKCCCCRTVKKKKDKERPSIVHPQYGNSHGIENKGVDTLKDADEILKNTLYSTSNPNPQPSGYDHHPNSNSNSANGGSVNSQDSLWNVKSPNNAELFGYQQAPQGYIHPAAYDQMMLQQHSHQPAGYPDDYTHYPHPEEYLNERNQQYLTSDPYRPTRQRIDSDYSAYGDMTGMTGMAGMPGMAGMAHHYRLDHVGSEEPQTPTHHVQMSFDDALDAANSGYPAQTPNGRSRRIIREIIV